MSSPVVCVLMFLGDCVHVFSCSVIVSCYWIVFMPLYSCPCIHALVLMPSYSCPRTLIDSWFVICYSLNELSVCLLVSCYPASIVLSLVFHGFVYVLPVWSFIKPLFRYIVRLGPTFLFHRLTPPNRGMARSSILWKNLTPLVVWEYTGRQESVDIWHYQCYHPPYWSPWHLRLGCNPKP